LRCITRNLAVKQHCAIYSTFDSESTGFSRGMREEI
jgi:hypothetical protein